MPTISPTTRQRLRWKHFEQLVETATGGAVQVEVFGNGALGGEVEAAQQARAEKTIQSVMLGSGTQASFYRNYRNDHGAVSLPDYRTAWAFFDSAWFAEFMKPMVAESGLRYLGTLDDGGGFVAFANNKRLIKTVEDLKGMRIRVEENQAHMTIMRALGAAPTPLPWGELQTGLATGLVDGHFHAPGVNDIFKLYDVTDYTTWSGHVYNTITWSVSEAWFKDLPRDYQEIIVASAREAVAMAHGIATQITVVGWVNSCEKFKECHVLSDAERCGCATSRNRSTATGSWRNSARRRSCSMTCAPRSIAFIKASDRQISSGIWTDDGPQRHVPLVA
ncbi:MAG: TRAP transporter substrate-binding protein DctP [Alphaproteobacteria bacterium]|nr:TRAP transporter substrate-binding protein DctP [Alphaproteobacteria bacterium]